jgi:UDP-N-acetylmuramyl pentapeptide phosphotransferase/UDP-N-acetylglucosamine-1-phosphate transferase
MTEPTLEVWSILGVLTIAATTLALLLVRPMLWRRGMIDVPNHRSSHAAPTLRGGGIGILIGLLTGWVVAALLVGGLATGFELKPLIATFIVVCLFGVLGWCEDCSELSIRSRLVAQCAVAIAAAVGFAWVVPSSIIVVALAAPALVFYVNVANFMDGINGISAQHGVVVAAYFGVLAYWDGDMVLALAACVLGCAFLSFFPWNVGRALMFLGDSGSYVLGASACILALWTLMRHSDLLIVAAPLIIYAADVVFTLMSRMKRHASLISSHREHVYQRLQQGIGSHQQAALVVIAFTGLCCALGLLVAVEPALRLAWYVGAVIVVGAYLISPRWISLLPITTREQPLLVSRADDCLPSLGEHPRGGR